MPDTSAQPSNDGVTDHTLDRLWRATAFSHERSSWLPMTAPPPKRDSCHPCSVNSQLTNRTARETGTCARSRQPHRDLQKPLTAQPGDRRFRKKSLNRRQARQRRPLLPFVTFCSVFLIDCAPASVQMDGSLVRVCSFSTRSSSARPASTSCARNTTAQRPLDRCLRAMRPLDPPHT
jgi:hypothetical protein